LRHIGAHIQAAQFLDEIIGGAVPVGAPRDRPRAIGPRLAHGKRR
jgi:hypothetical protein